MNKQNLISTFLRCSAIVYFIIQGTEAKPLFRPFLVPEEVPTLGSIIYSMLPPIKIGTDTRFGVGFRLGRNADVQFLVEFGPQTHTAPVGPAVGK